MFTAIRDDMFTPDVIADPYTYYGHLREEDPVHWNELYELWVITRHDDLVWLTRHHDLFSSEVLKRDPRPPYPQVNAADLELYEYVREFSSDQFIQHDRPDDRRPHRGSALHQGVGQEAPGRRPGGTRPVADPD